MPVANNEMPEEMRQMYARLTMHEYIVEVLVANFLVGIQEDDAFQFIEKYRYLSSSLRYAPDAAASEDVKKTFPYDVDELMERFFQKATRRVDAIRAQQAQSEE